MSTYVISYARRMGCETRIINSPLVHLAYICGQTLTMPIGGMLEKRVGPRLTSIIGCMIMSSSVYVSSFALDGWYKFAFFYGLMAGSGIGLTYTAPLACAARWLPQKKGFATGLITAGYGAGAVFLNWIQTLWINPENLSPDLTPYDEFPNERYFGNEDLLERVPNVLRRLATVYMVAQLVGIAMLSDPPSQRKQAEPPETPPAQRGISIKRALKTGRFWQLYACFFLNGLVVTFVATFWKAYGYQFFDKTLAVAGSIASLHNALGRIYWGKRADDDGVSPSLMYLSGLWTFLLLTFPHVSKIGLVPFTIWLCGIFFLLGGTFSLFPTAIALAFGAENFGIIYGILYSSQLVSSTFVALIAHNMAIRLGPTKLCKLFAMFASATGLLVHTLRKTGYSFDKRLKLL
eukprot:Selendium_serpulae@DN6044_c0_g1_i4.p1